MSNFILDLGADFGTDLSSRHRASELRIAIEGRALSASGPVFIDLSGVRSVSHSFADELFAVLVIERGEEWFRQNIHVEGLSSAVRQTILEAIQQRIEDRDAVSR